MYNLILEQLKIKQMKKLILLILLLTVSWKSFSQKDTKKDSIVPLKTSVAKLVIKDLLQGDGNKVELLEVSNLLKLTEKKVVLKDSVIYTLGSKLLNLETVITTKEEQFKLQQELSKKLEKELRVQKRNTFLYKVGTGVGVVASILLILK